jgi:hypothetical protein
VVIPTRHEAASIEPFLDRVLGTLQGIPTEMIVVDDSDHDHMEDLYGNSKATFGQGILVLRHIFGLTRNQAATTRTKSHRHR